MLIFPSTMVNGRMANERAKEDRFMQILATSIEVFSSTTKEMEKARLLTLLKKMKVEL